MGLAAAALYMACVENLVPCTQKDIALAASVTEVTIRNRYKGLRTKKNWIQVKYYFYLKYPGLQGRRLSILQNDFFESYSIWS